MVGWRGWLGDVLAVVRTARGKEAVAWGMKVESPATGILLPWVGSQRQVSRLLMGAGVYAHEKGDDGAAVEYLRDGLMLSRAVDRSPVLICHLVAIGIANQTAGLAGAMAGELRIGGAGGASGEQVMGLIGELMDDGAMRAGLVGAMEGERMFQYDTVISLAQRRLGFGGVAGGFGGNQASVMERWGARAISPMLMNEGREMLRWSNQMVEACRAEDGALASARIPALPGVTGGGMGYRTPVMSMLVPSLGAAMGRHYAGVYAMRGAGIELAGRMYEVETGKKAERLEDLLPKYLKEVPRDPVAGGGKAMPFAAGTQPSGR